MDQAAARGALSARQAQARAALFGLRTHLMPGTIALRPALRCGWAAVRRDPTTLPEAVLIVLKALVRLAVGERWWAGARQAKTKFG